MKNEAKNFKLSALNTYDECEDAIHAIENEPANIVGGLKAWCSGYTTELKQGAKNKIAAIQAKLDRHELTDEDGYPLEFSELSDAVKAFNGITSAADLA